MTTTLMRLSLPLASRSGNFRLDAVASEHLRSVGHPHSFICLLLGGELNVTVASGPSVAMEAYLDRFSMLGGLLLHYNIS